MANAGSSNTADSIIDKWLDPQPLVQGFQRALVQGFQRGSAQTGAHPASELSKIRTKSTGATPQTSSMVETMLGSQRRAMGPHTMRRRVMFSGVLILAVFLVQALCHSAPFSDGTSAARLPALTPVEQVNTGTLEHTEHIENACSGNAADPSCSDSTLSSCLLILFLSAGLSIPHKAWMGNASGRLWTTTAPPLRSACTAPDLHALGISRT